MSEQIEEIFAYYGKQRDKSSQEMVIALLRELQEAEGCITPELKVRVIETTEITDKFLNCLIKMYPSIKEAKQAHEIIACTGERCGKKDGMTILQISDESWESKKTGFHLMDDLNCGHEIA